MAPLKEKNASSSMETKNKKDLSQEKWKQDAKKNFGRSQSVLEQKKETTGESVQFPGLDGEALSFVDTNDFLLSSLFLLTDYDKGKEKKKMDFSSLENQAKKIHLEAFDGFCH